MGCSATSLIVVPKRTIESTNVEVFTERQKILVRKTWKYLSNDLTGYGTMVFLRIFEQHPHVKKLFPSICNDEGETLLKNPLFKGHASRFMQAVGAVVDNLDNLEEALAPLLIGLGRNHINFMGFRSEYFEAFTHAMVHVWKGQLKQRSVRILSCMRNHLLS